MQFLQCLLLEVFLEKKIWAALKHLNTRHGQQSVSYDQALEKLSEKPSCRLLVQEKHGFQKGAQCASLATGSKKAWPRVKKGLKVRLPKLTYLRNPEKLGIQS